MERKNQDQKIALVWPQYATSGTRRNTSRNGTTRRKQKSEKDIIFRRQNSLATALKHRSTSGLTQSEMSWPSEAVGAFQGLSATKLLEQKLVMCLLIHIHYQLIN